MYRIPLFEPSTIAKDQSALIINMDLYFFYYNVSNFLPDTWKAFHTPLLLVML